ncbi:MAG: CDP-glycerol glycerophosphotransferase family protein [bacterium]|nr:CDP-glycerol glycerophosphotransferase family protein [bacterium]
MINKTIFISAFNPFILRNVLASNVLKTLKIDASIKVVVFVPDYKADFFKHEIGAPNVIVEGVAVWKTSRRDTIFKYLTSSLVSTRTILVNKRVRLARDGRWFRFAVSWLIMELFSRLPIFKALVRRLDYSTIRKDYCSNYFFKYRPQLVFITDVFNDNDIFLLATAKRRGVSTIGMIRSWDNLTSKGILRIKPDKLIVHNEILQKQAIKYNDFSKKDIFISGIPQYDRYINGERMNREEFFKKIGLDPKQKLILFSPFGGRFTDTDWQIMEILKGFIKNKEIIPAQVLIRFTPNDPVHLGKFIPDENFCIDKPGRSFEGRSIRDQELIDADMDWLADCLYHSDVIVAGGGSIGIDAAIFSKPTILIHFDGFDKKPYWQSVKRFLEYQHPYDIIKSGAMFSAQNIEEFKKYLDASLKNPDLNTSARKEMLENQCWKLDGYSGERIGKFLLSLLY